MKTPRILKDGGRYWVVFIVSPKPKFLESAYWGVSEWGEAKWSAGDGVIEKIIEKLNAKNNNKNNNGLDALIAETALKNRHVLVTDDRHLSEVIQEMGGSAVSFQDFLLNNKVT